MAVKKVESFNLHETPAINQNEFDVETYLNANWGKTKEAVNNNAEELMQAQKDISTLKKDNKTNKSSIDVLEKSNETINKSLEDIDTKDKKQDEDIKANKESIEKIQAENLEIKSENERLRADIKSIAVINEVSGENIHVEDSSDARCEIEIGGNQKQETRSGKNRINLGLLGSGTLNGVKYTYNESNQSITFDGTCTKDNTRFIINDDANIQTIAKKTTLTAKYLAGSVSNYFTARIADNEWKHNLLLSLLTLNSSNNKVSLTETEDMVGVHIDIKANNGTTFNNFTIQLMLTDEVDTEYEMYGASPSIDYPSKAKSVGDNINMLFTNPDDWEQGTITDGANVSSMTRIRTKNFIDIIDNEDYYVSIQNTQYCFLNIVLYKEDKTYIGQYYSLNNAINGANHLKINLPTDAKKIRVIIRNLDNVSDISPSDIEMIKPKLEKSSVATPYSSYNCGSAKIDIFNKNYLSKIPKKSITAQGITSTFDGEKFICKGTAQTNYFNLLTEKVYKKIGKGIKTLSTNKLKKGRVFIHFYYVDGTDQSYYTSINTNQVSFTLNKDVESYRLNVDSITAGDTIDDNIYVQLEDGRIVTEIEKAENQEYLVDVQQPMLEGDYLDLENEKEHHKWEKVVLDGTETWLEVSYGFVIGVTTVDSIFRNRDKTKFDGYSNYLKVEKTSQAWTKINYCGWNTDGAFWIREDHTIAKNIDDFKAYLKSKYDSGNPVEIYYQLETPVELDFTDRQKLIAKQIKSEAHTYKNITNISAESSEVNPIICLKYLKDTETEHNKLQAQIDEIKELLSSTETSSLLLDNIQKDLESEV